MNVDSADLFIITEYLSTFQRLTQMGLCQCNFSEIYEYPAELEPAGTLAEWLH